MQPSTALKSNKRSIRLPWFVSGALVIAGCGEAADGQVGEMSEGLRAADCFSASGITERVSVSPGGEQANGHSNQPAISGRGRFVVFNSGASNLVLNDNNGLFDDFVVDRVSGAVELASIATDGMSGNSASNGAAPAISAGGRFVAFESFATNLIPGGTAPVVHIFLRDRLRNRTTLASVSSSGEHGNSGSIEPAVSADGRLVAFVSFATNLVPGDTNGLQDVFVHDRVTGKTRRVNVSSQGAEANGRSNDPALSGNGRFVAFDSLATNLVVGDTNERRDVFVHDLLTGKTERASVTNTGRQADGGASVPSLSASGRYIAFGSDATNLVDNDTNGQGDVFVRDRLRGINLLVSVSSVGAQGNGSSAVPSISADGQVVAFESFADNLAGADGNNDTPGAEEDIFVHELRARRTSRASVASDGTPGNFGSTNPKLSADGRAVAFESDATNLVAGDTNDFVDIFVHELACRRRPRNSIAR